MESQVVLDWVRQSLIEVVLISAPIMLIALLVGLIVSVFQTLTQIQEITLTFVPKIIVVFIGIIFFLPFMLDSMTQFAIEIFDQIVRIQ